MLILNVCGKIVQSLIPGGSVVKEEMGYIQIYVQQSIYYDCCHFQACRQLSMLAKVC